MSFRGRLTLFFVLIVVIPMIAIAFLVVSVAGDSASGKTDAALGEDLELASEIFDEQVGDAKRVGSEIAGDAEFQQALAAENRDAASARLSELAREAGVRSFEFESDGELGSFGNAGEVGDPFAAATINLTGAAGGELVVSTTLPDDYLHAVARATGERVAVLSGDGSLVGSFEIDPGSIPEAGAADDLESGDDELRIAAAELAGSDGARVALVAPAESGGFFASPGRVAAGFAAFILLALFGAVLLSRTLQRQIGLMLDAARRIGSGDFSGDVPVIGSDEMAGLASEFNDMRDKLSAQVDQLKRQRTEIERSVNRIGEAFASGLDAEALLPILAETAMGACEADYAMIALRGQVGGEHETQPASEAMRDAALEGEQRAEKSGEPFSGSVDGIHLISAPLGRMSEGEGPLGLMTVVREGEPFTPEQENVFFYLIGQAAASVENVALHEQVAEQAVTDELTGLPNVRAFRDSVGKEAARAGRFRHALSLIMLDIDNFKQVNDTYGHPQGDEVLRRIGAILREESRGIDEPARYGGEEFVVALPETAEKGALEVAERIRARIEAEVINLVDGSGKMRVTASLGAATMPSAALAVHELIAAADGALYVAKRSGKNQVQVAEGNGAEWRTIAE